MTTSNGGSGHFVNSRAMSSGMGAAIIVANRCTSWPSSIRAWAMPTPSEP